MSELNLNFLKKAQAGLEPSIQPGETAIEYLKRTEKEKMAAIQNRIVTTPPPPVPPVVDKPREVVFVDGHKLPRDFFTCVAVSLLKLGHPVVEQTFEQFGFQMKDLDGNVVTFKKKKKKR